MSVTDIGEGICHRLRRQCHWLCVQLKKALAVVPDVNLCTLLAQKGYSPYTEFSFATFAGKNARTENPFRCCGFTGTDCPRFVFLIILICSYIATYIKFLF